MEKIKPIEIISEGVKMTDLEIGDTIVINHAVTNRHIEVQIGNMVGDRVYWSTSDGKMGSTNINDVVRKMKPEDLVRKYFPGSPKLSQFRVPLEIFKETEKARLVGYIDDKGKQQSFWCAKKLMKQEWKNNMYAGAPPISYELAYLVFYDDDKEDFFKKYAEHIHKHEIQKIKRTFTEKWNFNRKKERESIAHLQKIFDFFKTGIKIKSFDAIDYESNLFSVSTNIGDIDVEMGHMDRMRIGKEIKFVPTKGEITETPELFDAMFSVMKDKKHNSKDTFNMFGEIALSYAKSVDPNFQYIDDGKKWRYQNEISKTLGKFKNLSNVYKLDKYYKAAADIS